MNLGRWFFVVLCFAGLAVSGVQAQAPADPKDYKPRYGQPGKDVVWIPTPDATLEKMLDMAQVTARDYVIDLGSGDGRNVIAAARRGARALGVEYNPDLVTLSTRNAAAAGVADRARFVHGDMFAADISQATVLPLFLIPSNLEKLAPKFVKLQPGTRIVSNTYEIGGGWEPDDTARTEPCASWCVAHLYIVPGNAAGAWRFDDGAWLFLEQSFQQLSGNYQIENTTVVIDEGRMRGNDIRFAVNNIIYNARINGDNMRGTAAGKISRAFTATRTRE